MNGVLLLLLFSACAEKFGLTKISAMPQGSDEYGEPEKTFFGDKIYKIKK